MTLSEAYTLSPIQLSFSVVVVVVVVVVVGGGGGGGGGEGIVFYFDKF